jgi:hypothetical protein
MRVAVIGSYRQCDAAGFKQAEIAKVVPDQLGNPDYLEVLAPSMQPPRDTEDAAQRTSAESDEIHKQRY